MGATAKFYYDVAKRAWILTGRDGKEIARFGEDKVTIVKNMALGNAGSSLQRIVKFTGTIPLSNVGSSINLVVTISGASDVSTGDIVLVSPKVAMISNVGIAGAYCPSTNCVNAILANNQVNSVGSQPPVGVEVVVIKS